VPEVDLAALDSVPNISGVYVLWPRQGAPHLGRTSLLRRRLTRLSRVFGPEAVARVEYYATGSSFESMVVLYRLARRYRRDDYRQFLRLRIPPFLKLNLANPYPRCYITRRLRRDRAVYFGPFTTRAAAERFQGAFLDLFLIRRCREEIHPDPGHPGCIYGEMAMCLRPCQGRASEETYRAEAGRVAQFLTSSGASLLRELESEREQASVALEFETAARVHRKLEKTRDALRLNEEMARDVDRLYGVVLQRSVEPAAVELWFLYQGWLQARRRLSLAEDRARPVSLDQRLRETIASIEFRRRSARERAELLGILLRWWGSPWKTGELILFEGLDQVPYRKLVRAIARTA
jgi:excinuclease UvrABC nuclease subunit